MAAAELEGTGLLFFKAYGALACTVCHVGVYRSLDAAAGHVKSHGMDGSKLGAFFDSAHLHSNRAPPLVLHTDGTFPNPVPFLSKSRGWFCRQCHKASLSPAKKDRHTHVGEGNDVVGCDLQSWYGYKSKTTDTDRPPADEDGDFVVVLVDGDTAPNSGPRGPNQRLFPVGASLAPADVYPHPVPEATQIMVDLFKAQHRKTVVANAVTSTPSRAALHVLGWPQFVLKLQPEDYDLYMHGRGAQGAATGDQEHLHRAARWCGTVFERAHDKLKTPDNVMVRQLVFSEKHKYLRAGMAESSVERSKGILKNVVMFALRLSTTNGLDALEIVQPELRDAARALSQQAQASTGAGDADVPPAGVETQVSDFLHALFFELVIEDGDSTCHTVLSRWMPMYFKGSPEAEFRPASSISTDLGRVDYIARVLLHHHTLSVPIASRDRDAVRQHFEDPKELLHATPTPYLNVVWTRQLFSKESASSASSVDVEYMDTKGELIRVKRCYVTLDVIGQVVRHLASRCWTMLQQDLMFGMTWPRLASDHCLVDDFSRKSPGFSFVQHPANSFGDSVDTLLMLTAMGDPDLCRRFQFSMDRFGKVTGQATALQRYQASADSFRDMLMVLVLLTVAGPPRGTELLSTLVVNTESALRDLFVSANRMSLVNLYNKTNAITGSVTAVPRRLPAAVSELLVHYLVLVRPFEVFVDMARYPSSPCPLFKTHLFLYKREKTPSSRLSQVLTEAFEGFGCSGMNISTYRHVSKAFGRQLGLAFDDFDFGLDESDEAEEQLFEEQWGHSVGVAKAHYGRVTHGWQGLDPNRTLNSNGVSDRWHAHLGIGEAFAPVLGTVAYPEDHPRVGPSSMPEANPALVPTIALSASLPPMTFAPAVKTSAEAEGQHGSTLHHSQSSPQPQLERLPKPKRQPEPNHQARANVKTKSQPVSVPTKRGARPAEASAGWPSAPARPAKAARYAHDAPRATTTVNPTPVSRHPPTGQTGFVHDAERDFEDCPSSKRRARNHVRVTRVASCLLQLTPGCGCPYHAPDRPLADVVAGHCGLAQSQCVHCAGKLANHAL